MTKNANTETREDVAERIGQAWEIHVGRKEIGRRHRGLLQRFWEWLIWKRYSVKDLYFFVYNEFHRPDRITDLMPIDFPMGHDNIKKPARILNIFQMTGGWKIASRDLAALVRGPLVSESGDAVLVEAEVRWDQIKRLSLSFSKIFIQAVGLIASIIAIYEFIIKQLI